MCYVRQNLPSATENFKKVSKSKKKKVLIKWCKPDKYDEIVHRCVVNI